MFSIDILKKETSEKENVLQTKLNAAINKYENDKLNKTSNEHSHGRKNKYPLAKNQRDNQP